MVEYSPKILASEEKATTTINTTTADRRKESERKHGALRPQKPLRLIRDGEVGGSGIFISNTYCHHQNDPALRRAAV